MTQVLLAYYGNGVPIFASNYVEDAIWLINMSPHTLLKQLARLKYGKKIKSCH